VFWFWRGHGFLRDGCIHWYGLWRSLWRGGYDSRGLFTCHRFWLRRHRVFIENKIEQDDKVKKYRSDQ
jgi:hypothetical protein